MKIGILTFFESTNYGTVLQAYALQKYLTDCGHEAEFVHIRRNVHTGSKHFKTQTVSYSVFDRLVIKLRSMSAQKNEIDKKEKFEAFRREYLNVSPVFYENDRQLTEQPPQYDLYLSGGDQVWNPYHKVFSTHYMWDFLPDGCAIASYASSFGIEAIDDDAIIGDMRRCLSRYRSIYVRERSGVDIVESMGLQATQVLDPVFLLRDQWQQFVHPCRAEKKYCLVYALIDYPKSEDQQIVQYARAHDLEVRIVPFNRRNCLNRYGKEFDAGPVEFLNLIAHAEFVFTNSFHGMAFSILFQKQFHLLSAVSEEGNKKRDRLNDLLKQCGITALSAEKPIDYAQVGQRLDVLIAHSNDMLQTICAIAEKTMETEYERKRCTD